MVGGGFKLEERFLDVRGEVGEVDGLRSAGTGDAGGAGDLGLVFDLPGGYFVTNGFFLDRHPDLPQVLIDNQFRMDVSQHGRT